MLFAAPSLDETEAKEQVSLAPDPVEDVLKTEDERMLRSAIRALPEPYRTTITLRYMSGLDSQEIALILKRPAGTVRYQLSRALSILRERLGREWQV
jgi:RNA polymerase sigma-70 factor (ECF subfamily)